MPGSSGSLRSEFMAVYGCGRGFKYYCAQFFEMTAGVKNMGWFKRSPWVLHYNATSCNGCDIEVIACLTPLYDLERFGIINTGNPKHADILLVTGSVNEKSKQVLKTLYDQMPNPKVIVAVGLCAISGCVFQDCYNVHGGC